MNFGLLTQDELDVVHDNMRNGTSRMSKKRLIVAVPFKGKDVPSRCVVTPRIFTHPPFKAAVSYQGVRVCACS